MQHRAGFVCRYVAGDIPLNAAGIILGVSDGGGGGHHGVNGDVKGPGLGTDVSGGIRCYGGDGVRAVGNVLGWGKAPLTARAYQRGANFAAIHANADRGAHFPRAEQGWAVIIGDAVVVDGDRDLRPIVDRLVNRRGIRGGGIDDDGPAVRRRAVVIVTVDRFGGQDIAAVIDQQQLSFPVAVLIHLGKAHLHRTVVDENG
ncbi:hypothetical protein D3C75_366310 [compost metagenome]